LQRAPRPLLRSPARQQPMHNYPPLLPLDALCSEHRSCHIEAGAMPASLEPADACMDFKDFYATLGVGARCRRQDRIKTRLPQLARQLPILNVESVEGAEDNFRSRRSYRCCTTRTSVPSNDEFGAWPAKQRRVSVLGKRAGASKGSKQSPIRIFLLTFRLMFGSALSARRPFEDKTLC